MALEWMADNLRVTLFSTESMKLTRADWTRITGKEEPETEQRVVGRQGMSGSFLEGQLTIAAAGSRVDCTLTPSPPMPAADASAPVLGKWLEKAPEFVGATGEWVSTVSFPIVRIAFGAGLLAAQRDLEQAYVSVLGLLKSVDGDPVRMRDFMFRINWPRNSTSVNGLTINRLTTWSVLRVQWLLGGEPARPQRRDRGNVDDGAASRRPDHGRNGML
jgi:hypothetical protein